MAQGKLLNLHWLHTTLTAKKIGKESVEYQPQSVSRPIRQAIERCELESQALGAAWLTGKSVPSSGEVVIVTGVPKTMMVIRLYRRKYTEHALMKDVEQ